MLSFARLVMHGEGITHPLPLDSEDDRIFRIFWHEMIKNYRIMEYLRTRKMSGLGLTIPEIFAMEDVLTRTEKKAKDAAGGVNFADAFDRGRVRTALLAFGKRSIFEMETRHFGIGPRYLEVGDRICVFDGSNFAVVLRREDMAWVHVGRCYVPNLDDLLAEKMSANTTSAIEEFEIK